MAEEDDDQQRDLSHRLGETAAARETPPPDSAPPLAYISARDDRELIKARQEQRQAGAAISFFVVIGAVALYIFAAMNLSPVSPQARTAGEVLYALIFPAALFLGLGLVAAYQHFVRRRRWFIQGVLIGIGIACLIEGACFAYQLIK